MKSVRIALFMLTAACLNAFAVNQATHEQPLQVSINLPDIAAIEVIEKRPYVLSGNKLESYSGQAINWKGPYNDGLDTGEPMTQYLYRKLLTLQNNKLIKNGGTLKLVVNEWQIRIYPMFTNTDSKLVADIELAWYKNGKRVFSKQYVEKIQTDYTVPTIHQSNRTRPTMVDAVFTHYLGIMLTDFFTQINQGAEGEVQSKSPCSAEHMKKLVAQGFSIDEALDICSKQ